MASKLLAFTLTCPRPFTASPTFSSLSSSTSVSRLHHPIQFNTGRHSCLRRRLFEFSLKAASDQQEDAVVDSKILQYCSIDQKEKKSIGELEQEFLQALQVYIPFNTLTLIILYSVCEQSL